MLTIECFCIFLKTQNMQIRRIALVGSIGHLQYDNLFMYFVALGKNSTVIFVANWYKFFTFEVENYL